MKKSSLVYLLVGLGILGVIGYRISGGGMEQYERPPAEVIALRVYTDTLSDQVEALGTTRANESLAITANTTETIEEIRFTDGQRVEAGHIIALLDQKEERAQLEAAKAQLREHERELERLKTLLKNKAASRREFDERTTQAEITRKQIKEIQARIGNRTLAAPFDGILGIRRLSVGALVQPGDLITTLDQVNPIKLDFSVPEIYLSRLKPGLPIRAVSDSMPGKFFAGEVQTVNSRVDPVTRSVLLRALIDNEEGLILPGMLMKVTLLEEQREAVIVPEESIIQRQDKHYITLVTDDGTASERAVEIGVRRPGIVEIVRGLAANDIIVVRGMGNVRSGQKVKVQEVWEHIQDEQYPDSSPPSPAAEESR